MSHYFFTFYPTHERNPKHGRATHYCRNEGLITLDTSLALHITNSVRYGRKPTLFAQGWLNRRNNTFNVGLEVPRNSVITDLYHQEQLLQRNNLLALFGE